MTVTDSSTLSALIKAYAKAVVFEEALPNPLRVAKVFSEMQWAHGGLVLLGVRQDGFVAGIDPMMLDDIYERFGSLCADLTESRVEIGTLAMGDRMVVFIVFNTIPRHTDPLRTYSRDIARVMIV